MRLQLPGGLRVGTQTPADFSLLADEDFPDLPQGFHQVDRHVVVPALEQHLALELDQLVLAGTQHQADQLVVDVGVDIEQFPEQDDSDFRVLLGDGLSLVVDHLAKFQHLLEHLDVGLLPPVLGEAAGFRSAVLLFAYLESLHSAGALRLGEGIH